MAVAEKPEEEVSASQSNKDHRKSDVDSGKSAQHHTLGPSPVQAAPGNHAHNGYDSTQLFPGGTTGQALVKNSGTDYDYGWATVSGGGGGGGVGDPGTNGIMVRTALNTTVARSLTGTAKVSITNPDGVAGNPQIDINESALSGIPESAVTNLVTDLAGKAASVHSHAESDVTSLVTDLAAKAPTARLLNTTAPITGGGDLSADRTLAIAANGVTNALLGQMAANTVKGNNTGALATPVDLTMAQLKTLLALTEADITNLVADLAAKAAVTDVQIFTANGTWTKPANAKATAVWCIGGGGGGGSGRCDAAGTARGGGGGGGGGGYSWSQFRSSDLPATVTVTVPAVATGGTGVSTAATNGNAGGTAGTVTFGTNTVRAGGGGGGGGGGSAAGGTAGSAAGGHIFGVAGAVGSNGTAVGANGSNGGGPTGGGGGGGLSTANALVASGSGGIASGMTGSNGAAGGGAGPSGVTNSPATGGGGGGGAASIAGAGQAGGAGGKYGGGGGGGGASVTGQVSGAGGNGGPGICIVITTF